MAVPLPQDSSDAFFSWFTEFQRSCILKNGIVPEWFHGTISRKAAEEMLMCKPCGYFLIRVSESRVGYTLSYRAEDRCRHFMIDLMPDNQFVIVGDKMHHSSLHDLVAFHRRNPIAPYGELLTMPCEQGGKNNYEELLFPRNNARNFGQNEGANAFIQTHETLHSNISELNPASPLPNESLTTPTSPTSRLYPCLETELTDLNLQSTPTKPVPRPRTIYRTASLDTPPQLPPRSCLPSRPQATVDAERSQGQMTVWPDREQIPSSIHCEDKGSNRNQQKNQQHLKNAIMGLAQLKKKIKKKRSMSEENTYEEITVDVCHEQPTSPSKERSDVNPQQTTVNNYQELSEICPVPGNQRNDGIPHNKNRELPKEYLNPPPFAPGY